MSQTNGSNPGPPYAVIGTGLGILPHAGVIEMLEKNILLQGKENLAIVPLFRKAQEAFRDWSKIAEPGWWLRAPEVNLIIIRMSIVQPATVPSDAASEQAEAAQAEPGESRLRIATE